MFKEYDIPWIKSHHSLRKVTSFGTVPLYKGVQHFLKGLGTAVAGGSALALLLRHGRRRSTKSQRCHVIRLAAPQNIAANPEKAAFPQIPMPVVAGALATLAVAASNPAMAQEVADAAADIASAAEDAEEVVGDVAQSSGDWFEPLIQFNAGIIAGIDGVIEDQLHIPNSFGFAIIGYTLLIKVLTYPLNQSALRSGAIMQLIRPKVDQVQRKYKNDQETQNRMLLRLYDDCGVNPLGGCIPSLVQFPIFIGLYRSILKLSQINPKFQEPFLWIPSLAGPTAGTPSLDRIALQKHPDALEALEYFLRTNRSKHWGQRANQPESLRRLARPFLHGYFCYTATTGEPPTILYPRGPPLAGSKEVMAKGNRRQPVSEKQAPEQTFRMSTAWRSRDWAGSGGGLGRRWSRVTPRLFCVAGMALDDICFRFVWQAWRLATSAFVLCGRRGTHGTGLALVAALVGAGPV
eukprot:s3940_g9.t2